MTTLLISDYSAFFKHPILNLWYFEAQKNIDWAIEVPSILTQISNFQTTVSNRVIHKGVCVWHSSSQKVDGNLSSSWKSLCSYGNVPSALLDTIQDFLNELGIEPQIHLAEIIIFSVYHVIIRPTKSMQRADKNWAHF